MHKSMLLYLKNESVLKRTPDVCLLECHRPSIGTTEENRVEPAIWFKTLVIDSLLVDIDKRAIYWSRDKPEIDNLHLLPEHEVKDEVLKFFNSKERVSEDGEYDFDPNFEELLYTATGIHRKFSRDQKLASSQEQSPKESAHRDVLRILHCFILPVIKFGEKDVKNLKAAEDDVKKRLKKVQRDFDRKCNSVKTTENSLSSQRSHVLCRSDFTNVDVVMSCPKDFLAYLLADIEDQDLVKMNEELEKAGLAVEKLRNSTEPHEKQLFEDERKKRNALWFDIERLTMVRETIKNVTSRHHIPRKQRYSQKPRQRNKHLPDYENYVRVAGCLKDIKDDIEKILVKLRKICLVQEILEKSLNEIETVGEMSVYQRGNIPTTSVETGNSDQSKPEEWKTLTEKVADLLNQPKMQSQYKTFCELLTAKCQQLLDESKMFSARDCPEEIQNKTSMVESSKVVLNTEERSSASTVGKTRKRELSSSSLCSISDEQLQSITNEIKDHIWNISSSLVQELKHPEDERVGTDFFKIVYFCYESHIFQELMVNICQLFECRFEVRCNSLLSWLSCASLTDILFDEFQIAELIGIKKSAGEAGERLKKSVDKQVIAFEPHMMSKAFHAEALPSRLSFTLEHGCSELYRDANQDCRDLNDTVGESDPFGHDGINSYGSAQSQKTEDSNSYSDRNIGSSSVVLPPATTRTMSSFEDCDTDNEKDVGRSQPPQHSHAEVMKTFHQAFVEFEYVVAQEEEYCSVFRKIHQMADVVQYITKQLVSVRKQNGDSSIVTSDDLIPVIVLLLMRLDGNRLLKMYAHLEVITKLEPGFTTGNVYDFALTTLQSAFMHLLSCQKDNS